jgi:hypothetical protein
MSMGRRRRHSFVHAAGFAICVLHFLGETEAFVVSRKTETRRRGLRAPTGDPRDFPGCDDSCLLWAKKDDSNDDISPQDDSASFLGGYSYELLAALISIIFVATVSLSNGALFAPAPSTSSIVRVDADEVLRQDFTRSETSIKFDLDIDKR